MGFTFQDFAERMKWPMIALFLAMLYHIYVFINGGESKRGSGRDGVLMGRGGKLHPEVVGRDVLAYAPAWQPGVVRCLDCNVIASVMQPYGSVARSQALSWVHWCRVHGRRGTADGAQQTVHSRHKKWCAEERLGLRLQLAIVAQRPCPQCKSRAIAHDAEAMR